MDIDQFLDHVKAQANIKSDGRLSELLERHRGHVWQYRMRGVLPSDETMIRLAEIGNFDTEDALLLLNIWRTTGEAKKTYERMRKRAVHMVAGFFVGSIALISHDVSAQVSTTDLHTVYYEKLRKRLLKLLGITLATA